MPKLSEGLETSLEIALASYKEEYTRVATAWKDLETKAAAVITVGGIFLGFVLNFIKDTHLVMNDIQQALSGATLLSLLVTLLLAITSIFVRERVRAPESEDFYIAIKDLHQNSNASTLAEYSVRVLKDQIRGWASAVRSRSEENESKAKYIRYAQVSLLISMCLAAGLAGLTLLTGHGTDSADPARSVYERGR